MSPTEKIKALKKKKKRLEKQTQSKGDAIYGELKRTEKEMAPKTVTLEDILKKLP